MHSENIETANDKGKVVQPDGFRSQIHQPKMEHDTNKGIGSIADKRGKTIDAGSLDGLHGDKIESRHRHDYVECKCGACAVDGGHDYLRRCFKEQGCFTDISVTAPDNEQSNQE